METSTSGKKSKKVSKGKDSPNSSQVRIGRSVPGEEEIHEKTRDINEQRIEMGEDSAPGKDWFEAESYLRDSEW
jgi:hypothetical protein